MAGTHPAVQRTRRGPAWENVALAFLLALFVLVFVMQGYRVYGPCMEPHLYTGERVLANKLAYVAGAPRRGDIIMFRYPPDPRQIYVKRIVGLPGEFVSIRSGQVYIGRKRLLEPYRIFVAHGNMPPRCVPRGEYFVMGDNRDMSDDSRVWGEVPRRAILSRAVACYWPPRACQILH